MSDYRNNAYAREQRMAKATALREFLTASGGLWADRELWPQRALRMPVPTERYADVDPTSGEPTPEQRKLRREIERRAGVRRCSEETWDLALQLLEQHRRDSAAQAAVDEELGW